MRRTLNVRFLALLVLVGGVCSVSVYFVHGYQVRRNASALLVQATQAEEQGQLDRAAGYLNRYLGLMPDDTDALARYGMLLDKRAAVPNSKERLHAFLILEQVIRRDPERREVRRQLARVAMAPDLLRFTDAREHLTILLKATPEDGELEFLLARCLEESKEYSQAATVYRQALRHEPGRVESYSQLASLLRRHLNKPAEADQVMDALIEANYDAFRAYLARARYRRETDRVAEAAQDLARAYELAPQEVDVVLAVAEGAANRANGTDEARRYLERGLDPHPRDIRLQLALARLELRAGNRPEAVRWLRQVHELAPTEPEVLWTVADLFLDAEEPDEARAIFTQLHHNDNSAPLVDYLEARIQLREGAWLRAATRLTEVRPQVVRSPELSKRVNFFLGQCYEQLGNPDLAVSAYRQAAAADPLWVPARMGIASASLTLGKIDSAIEEYRLVQERVPASLLAVARLLILRNLRAPTTERNWTEVLATFQAAEQALPDSAEVPVLRAEVLAAQNQLTEAQALLEAVPEKQRRNADYWVARAGLAERMGQPERTLPLLEEGERLLGANADLQIARLRYWANRPPEQALPALAQIEDGVPHYAGADQSRLRGGLAEVYHRFGKVSKAQQLWNQVADAAGNENSLAVRLLLFDIALEERDNTAMQRVIGQIRSIEGADGALWRYAEAARLVRMARPGDSQPLAQARTHLLEVSKRRPAWARVPWLEADIAEVEGDGEEAIQKYLAAVEKGERQPSVLLRLVQLLYDRRRYLEAEQVLRKLPRHDPISGDLGKLAAEISLRNQDSQRALELARLAVSGESRDYHDHIWLGRLLWALNRLKEAEEHLHRAIELGPGIAEPWVELVQFLARTEQTERADRTLQEAGSKIPEEQRPLALAQCNDVLDRLPQAEEHYLTALRARPADATVLHAVVWFYLRHQQPAKAEPLLRRLLDPEVKASGEERGWARRNLAFALATQGKVDQFDQALNLLEQNRQSGSDSLADQRTRAVLLAMQPRQQREAIRLLEDLARRQPLTPDEQFLLAKLYQAEGDWRRARERLLTLVTLGAEKEAAGRQRLYLNHYIDALLRRGETDEAELWLQKLEKLDSSAAQPLELKTRLLHQQSKDREALAVIRAYLAGKEANQILAATLLDQLGEVGAAEAETLYRRLLAGSKDPELLLRSADFFSRHQHLPEALDLCEQVGQTTRLEVVASLSVRLLRAGQADAQQTGRVEQWLTKFLEKQPSLPVLLALAELRDFQARYQDAVDIYRQVLRQDGHNLAALNNLAWLLALQFHQQDEALALINEAIEAGGPVASLLDTRAVLYLQRQQPEQALKDMERVVAQQPSATSYFHLAQVQNASRNRLAATAALRRARDLGLARLDLHPLEHSAFSELQSKLEIR